MQLLIFITLTIGVTIALTLIAGFIVASVFGIRFEQLTSIDITKLQDINPIKWLQLISAITTFLIPSLLFAYLSDSKPMKYAGLKQPIPKSFYLIAVCII